MSTSPAETTRIASGGGTSSWRNPSKDAWWAQHREASLNWLALGVLLAAWNASSNDTTPQPKRRPESLRGYACVSVRAATLHAELFFPKVTKA